MSGPVSDKMTPKAGKGRKKPIFFPPDVLEFLETILTQSDLDHTAPLPEFIKNNTLDKIREMISNEATKYYNKSSSS